MPLIHFTQSVSLSGTDSFAWNSPSNWVGGKVLFLAGSSEVGSCCRRGWQIEGSCYLAACLRQSFRRMQHRLACQPRL